MPRSDPVPPRTPVILPSRYYFDHFDEMLTFVESGYGHVLESTHSTFIKDFRSLNVDAACLYVRLANRKGRVFYRDSLRYEEISSLDGAVAELLERRFIRLPVPGDYANLLSLKTRLQLATLIKEQSDPGRSDGPRISSAKKADLLHLIPRQITFERAFPEDHLSHYLLQDRCEEVDFLLFLYFGRLQRGMTTFALRDLGLIRTSGFRTKFEARFPTRESAASAYHYAKVNDSLEQPTPGDVDALLAGLQDWPLPDDAATELARHQALHRLGRELERASRFEDALSVFSLSDQFPATERTVRLLLRLDDREGAEAFLLKLIDNPSCDEELIFAEDFYERKFHRKKMGRLTSLLRNAVVLPLDESGRDRPEAAAVRHFERRGVHAAHVENVIWQQLFGLLFWDLLFDPATAAIHNAFEFKPQDLNSGDFHRRHHEAIREKLKSLDDPPAALAALRATWELHSGTPNDLVPWYPDLFLHTCRLVEFAPPGGLASILESMAENHRANRSGFPDLIVFENEGLRFVEIKTEGDQIRRSQLVQMERLTRAGLTVELARVQWVLDPEQEYVVVDIETTGGRADAHRITEIGAVKLRGDTVIGEWSSLINPERSIPKFIVGLTGITDSMVADAPRFEEIADSFREFVGEAVFVAHRVKFDHGFIRAEFQRLGQEFRCPTLCTVVSMRRYFPGLPSYGLGPLCATLGIPLESHHRALCDARATAELLKRINGERFERQDLGAVG